MTKTAYLANELESNSVEDIKTERLMRFAQLIIKVHNEQLKEAKEELKQ